MNGTTIPLRIVVTEIISVEPGSDSHKDSVEALFKVRIKYHDPDIDNHIANLNPEEFIWETEVHIEDFRKENIVPGVYKREVYFGKTFFVKEETEQEVAA